MNKTSPSSFSFVFILTFITGCGSSNPSEEAGSPATTSARVLNAGTAISEEFPPSPLCEPTATTGVIQGSVKDPFLDFVVFGAGVTLTREGTSPQHTSTDEHGTYRFCNLEPGIYQLAAYALGFESVNGTSELNVEVKAGLFHTSDLELNLGAQEIPSNIGAVRGSVSDKATLKVLSGVAVEALNNVITTENGTTGDIVKGTETDINGEFFLSLSIGTHVLRISKQGYITPAILLVTIHSDKVTRLRNDPVELFPE